MFMYIEISEVGMDHTVLDRAKCWLSLIGGMALGSRREHG